MVSHPNRNRKAKAAADAASAAITIKPPPQPGRALPVHDTDYAVFLDGVQSGRERASLVGDGHLFVTDAADLFTLYLDALPGDRHVHTCHACRRFIETYGGLVAINTDGWLVPAMWSYTQMPAFYRNVCEALRQKVTKARVTGVFLSAASIWGTPVTGPWTHLSVRFGKLNVFRHPLLTAEQAMAAKRQDYSSVSAALREFPQAVVSEALRLLETNSLANSQKFIGPVRWLHDLHAAQALVRKPYHKENLVWRAVAAAPDGYCHPRASVVGSLLEDIGNGIGFELVRHRFNAKVAPLAYQRPQIAPAAGNIAAGEKIVEQLGIRRSLVRRYARLEDVETVWQPVRHKQDNLIDTASMIFGHLKPKGAKRPGPHLEIPAVTMTWVKFVSTVLPAAEAIDMLVPSFGTFIALTTAMYADAPPILKWDREDRRNPVSWYVYPHGSNAIRWSITPGWCKVTAIAELPSLWGDRPSPFLGEGVVLILDRAKDTRHSGGALFPEQMRGELHAIRSTIEAFSQSANLFDQDKASACGWDVREGFGNGYKPFIVRVNSALQWTQYQIDRWD